MNGSEVKSLRDYVVVDESQKIDAGCEGGNS